MDALLLPILIPGAAGLLALVLPGRLRFLQPLLGGLAAFATFVLASFLVGAAPRSLVLADLEIGGVEADLVLRSDAFSSWATTLAALLGLVCLLYAAGWFRGRGGAPGRFYGWLLLALTGAEGVLLADNLLVLLVGWEVVTVALFLLVITAREDGGKAATKALAILGLGDLALLVGIVILGLSEGTWSMGGLGLETDAPARTVAWLLFFVAACAKAGAMPFHTWIPTLSTGAHASVMAFLPGSLDKVLGIYLLARICPQEEWFATPGSLWLVPSDALRVVVMTLGAVTILGAVFMALVQHDLRRLLAYHAVSQVGYMLLGLGTGTIVGFLGGLFHMLNNAVYKACLFLGAGSVEREAGTMDLKRLGGLGRAMPLTFGSMFVASLAISGIPPLNGFVSKWFVYRGCVEASVPLLLVAALFGSALTLASFVKVLHAVFFGPRPPAFDGVREGQGGIGMPVAMVTLALLCVLLGLFAPWAVDVLLGPATLASGTATAVAQADLDAVTGGDWTMLHLSGLVVLAFLAALFLAFVGQIRAQRVRSVFVGGRKLDPAVNRFPGTEFYRTVQDLPGLGRVLEAGERGAFDPYVAGERLGRPLVRLLRGLHSGLATDYVVFCLLGLAVLLAVLMLGS